MTQATRDALEQVSRILHDAGWDAPTASPDVTEDSLRVIRQAYADLLREDDWVILRETLGKGQQLEDASRVLGMSPTESRTRLFEALTRLVNFAGVAEAQGFTRAG